MLCAVKLPQFPRLFSRPRVNFLVFILLSITCPGGFAGTTLKLAHVGGENQAFTVGAERFAENLSVASGRKMSVEIFPGMIMGGIADIWLQMKAGSVDMQVIDVAAISMLKEAAEIQVVLTPFLFRDQAHLHKYLDSDLFAATIENITAATGIRYLGAVAERAPRVISTTSKPVTRVEDLKGLKFRVPGHPLFMAVFENWGAIPTPLSPADMFMALKSGMVAGEDNGVINLVNGSNIEVIQHFTPINWNRSSVGGWISERTWSALSPQERAWVQEAMDLTQAESRAGFTNRMAEAMQMLEQRNVTVHKPELKGFLPVRDAIAVKHEGTTWPAGQVKRILQLQ